MYGTGMRDRPGNGGRTVGHSLDEQAGENE
ncbi:hypothetical protein BJ969_005380 [Saccharopolyspora gloriosae]|uniref:Uncharacterized protein n=1 Tax=Saccharopolyspora gloriosae TaxID=455344 RepID=A0A840NSZ4_9PSEU|nr:hypothetical protein [Saccharopolyspora gloriosae]